MKTRWTLLCALAALLAVGAYGQERLTIVLKAFKTAPSVAWPYETEKMTKQLLAELQHKDGKKFYITAESPEGTERYYVLEGEVLEWRQGNRGTSASGCWYGERDIEDSLLVDQQHGEESLRASGHDTRRVLGQSYADSVGQLAHPFSDKVAGRLAEAKL